MCDLLSLEYVIGALDSPKIDTTSTDFGYQNKAMP